MPRQSPSAPTGPTFRPFDPSRIAGASIAHMSAMADPKLKGLPFGQVQPWAEIPFAEHSRQDDSEFAASWFEGISCAREMIGTDAGAEAEAAFRAIVLDPACWEEESGLRFPAKRPWTGSLDWCVIPEEGVVLSALNRMLEANPKDSEAEKRAAALVAGLDRIATRHEARLTPTGAFPCKEPLRYFHCDVLLRGSGFAPQYASGYSDTHLRNCALIRPLVARHRLTGDKVALSLAIGLANGISGPTHRFSFKTEFQGDVHSAIVTATGLSALGRLLSDDRYVARAKALFDCVRRNSSAFGWVPEFLQWQAPGEQTCDAAVVADMLECALELIDCGFPEYWDDAHRFWRNHLAESQISDASFVPVPAKRPADTAKRTCRDIAKRLPGAGCGATTPGFVALNRPRAISARATAAIPRASLAAWRHSVEISRDIFTVNFPVAMDLPEAKVETGYPDSGLIRVTLKKPRRVNLRAYPWMGIPHEGRVDGRPAAVERREDLLVFPAAPGGAVLEFRHKIDTRRVLENVASLDFFGLWRGPDMVDLLPHSAGSGFRLYRRKLDLKPESVDPPPEGAAEIPPFCEPPVVKEPRLNRRKAPRA